MIPDSALARSAQRGHSAVIQRLEEVASELVVCPGSVFGLAA